tara:strand:+ start:335 stop:1240 length:906 start_codon:yes stop_codon:yes gene_type:complete
MSDQEEIKKVEEEIAKTPLEIELVDDKEPEKSVEQEEKPEQEAKDDPEDKEFSRRVQKRISTLVQQRKQAEAEAEQSRSELDSLRSRLDKLEKGSDQQAQNQFQERYNEARSKLQMAIEEGNTEEQVAYQEQLADMRAAMRVQEMQRQQQVQQQVSPTVGRAAQVQSEPTPQKAIDWWQKNRWFNSDGYERETAAARAIDVQLDLEGYDKSSDEYYDFLNDRLRKVFPELIPESKVKNNSAPRTKSRSPVAPTAGGPSRRGGRVKMTKDQLALARELGITDERSLKAYESELNAQKEANNG